MRKLLILICLFISAQLSAQVYQVMPQYGYQTARMRMDSVLIVPSDTIRNKSGVARIGTQLYAGNGSYWTLAGGGADSSVYFTKFRSDTMRENIYSAIGNVPPPTLQQVLDNNHDLTDGNNFQGTNAGFAISPLGTTNTNAFGNLAVESSLGTNINGFGQEAARQITGDNVNALGYNSAKDSYGNDINALGNGTATQNSGNDVNAIGRRAGELNIHNNVNLLGALASATNDNQTSLAGATYQARIDYNRLSASQQYDLPDSSGTIALLSNIPDSSTYFTNYRADTMRSNLYANKVPYTGATQDVDLGAHKISAQTVQVKGTAGAGHLGLKHQSAAATASGQETSIYADNNGDVAWKNDNLYITTLKTSGNTANRIYTFPDSTGTIAITKNLTTKADLAGPTFTDSLVLTSTVGGISLPNMTQTQMNAITPRLGTQVYNTTYDAVCTYTSDFGWWSNDPEWLTYNGWDIREEFNGILINQVSNGFSGNFTLAQTNGTFTGATPQTNRPAILSLTTHINSNGTSFLNSDGAAFNTYIAGGGKTLFETDVQIPTLSSATETFRFFAGFSSSISTIATRSIAFFYDSSGAMTGSAASGRWQVVCANASNRSYTTTNIQVTAGQWYRLKAIINAAGTQVDFYIDGTLVKSETNNIPSTGTSVIISIVKSAGTTARSAFVDFFRLRQKFTTPR